MDIFNHEDLNPEEYQARTLSALENLAGDNSDFDYSFLKPEIFSSWKRSLQAGLDINSPFPTPGPDFELKKRLERNKELIDVARPYMKNLYNIVKGSGSYLLLCDREGYVLYLVGDPSIVDIGRIRTGLVLGACRSESVSGTNAIGTCLITQKPIQIRGAEHFLKANHGYTCSAAPIFSDEGELLGCFDITGLSENTHLHTLGMVMSAVDGINKEISLRSANAKMELISAQRNGILQAMNTGIILLNTKGQIVEANNRALNILGHDYDSTVGANLFDFISFNELMDKVSDWAFIQKEVYNRENTLYFAGSKKAPARFNISINFVRSKENRIEGTVISISETKMINQLVSSIGGYTSKYTFDSIIGSSEITKNTLTIAKRASRSMSNVLILGESGTGKELLAQSIHNASSLSSRPFVALNCAALPRSLVESELFGYEKGAFTGANKEGNPGKFELADGGTIFFDEIGDMPLDVQAAVLRVIQTREITRIGGKYPKRVNVRIIAATNKDLEAAIKENAFREDLYYRLNVLRVNVPPLRERPGDIMELAEYFIHQYAPYRTLSISPESHALLENYGWPGNIRQLENVIERAINTADGDIILPNHLPPEVALPEKLSREDPQPAVSPWDHTLRKNNPREKILMALDDSMGNVTKAAEILGISRRTLYRKMEKFGIDRSMFT